MLANALGLITRETFQELTASLLQKTLVVTRSTLQAAYAKGVNCIDQIILVGGSTRMPQVKELLEAEFPVPCARI